MGGDLGSTLLMVALMGAALYFLMIRPQQRRTKEQKDALSALTDGSRVMLVSGIVGTVRHLGEKQAIIEVAPGVEMTVVKAAISTQPVEDEFEYVDEPELSDETLVPDSIIPEASDAPVTFDPTPPPSYEVTPDTKN